MNKHLSFAVLLFAAGLAHASETDTPAIVGLLDGARELGRVNGLALACGHAQVSSKARAMMVLRSPKTRRFGEAFENASTEAFNEQTAASATCPEPVVLELRLEMTELRMQELTAQAEKK